MGGGVFGDIQNTLSVGGKIGGKDMKKIGRKAYAGIYGSRCICCGTGVRRGILNRDGKLSGGQDDAPRDVDPDKQNRE